MIEQKALLLLSADDEALLKRLKTDYNKQVMRYNTLALADSRMTKPLQIRMKILYRQIAKLQQQQHDYRSRYHHLR
jgi:hypothetical protein